jgi:hypothetical protein
MRTATASYEGQERGRGDRFLDEVKEGLQRTQQCPRLCPMYEGNYRRYLLNRFPFGLMNRTDPEQLFLMAVAHLRGQLPRPHRRFSTQTECRPIRERHATRPDPRLVRGAADIPRDVDPIDHARRLSLVARRISARRVLKLIRQWPNAGVVEQGQSPLTEVGSPPGGGISPVLANGEYGLAPVG